jgi:transmembrane sensor
MNPQTQIAEEAAAWVDRLNKPVFDVAAGPNFDAWMAAAPRHREVFADLQALWQSDALVEALSHDETASTAAKVSPTLMNRYRTARRAAPRFLAAACAMTLAFLLTLPMLSTTTYRTGSGSGKSVTLADGSRVDLSGDTELRVQILPWTRNAVLARGEAFFDVHHESARSFQVASGTTSVRVLGTAFNVDRQSATRTAVSVYRGAVEVAVDGKPDRVLHKGDGARVVDGRVTEQPRIVESSPDWKSGWFVASDVPLGVLISKVQRYSARPIELHGSTLQTLPISGRFHVSDTDRVLQAVRVAYNVDVSYGPEAISIRAADAGVKH